MTISDRRPAAWSAPKPWVTALLFVLLCLGWGSTWLVIKLGLRDVPPFTGAALRFLVAGLCMAVLAGALAEREGGGRSPPLVILSHGILQFSLNYGLVYLGETVIPSGMVAVLWAVFPLFVAMGEHFVVKSSSLSSRKWLGIGLSFGGVAALFVTDLARVDARAVPMGFLVLLAPLGVTVSTLLIKNRAAGSSSLLLNRDGMLLGAAALGATALLLERPFEQNWTSNAVLSVLYLALIGTVFCFGVYQWLLRFVPAYRLSLISFVTPVVALLLGAVVGAEPVGVATVLGTGLVLGGMALALGRAPSSTRG